MSFVLGIDIGMSHTGAAIGRRRSDGSMAYESLQLGSRKATIPSVVFLVDHRVIVGEAAEREAVNHPDRVVREFKRRIGDETPIIVGDLSISPESVFALLARWVVERAVEHEGARPAITAVSHPAAWGEHRLSLVRTALTAVGLSNLHFVSEPEAAGLHHLMQIQTGETIAVYDLGGCTLDVALMQKTENDTFQLIGSPAGMAHLGGADFDQHIYERVRSQVADALDEINDSTPDGALTHARIRRECADAKEALSSDTETFVPVFLSGAQTRVRLVRSEFEQMIDGALRASIECLRGAIANADLQLSDISTILLVGGSSRIPAVAQLISAELKLPIAVDSDPKASICLGAAAAAARSLNDNDETGDVLTKAISTDTVAATKPLALARQDTADTVLVARAGSRPDRMSVGIRAAVLTGVAAAVVAALIPVTPIAIGTQDSQSETLNPSKISGATETEGHIAANVPNGPAQPAPITSDPDASQQTSGEPEPSTGSRTTSDQASERHLQRPATETETPSPSAVPPPSPDPLPTTTSPNTIATMDD